MSLITDRVKAIRYEHPEKIPISIGMLPAIWKKYGAELNKIRADFPDLFGEVNDMQYICTDMPASYRSGSFTDAWGCVWSNVIEGHESIVTGHPLPNREDVNTLKAPTVDAGLPHGFMFLRLFDLRGFEEMMIDFAEEPKELQLLIDIVRDYNINQLEKICQRSKDEILWLGDDNGHQTSLPISPAKWRKYIKPAYKAIFDVAKKHNRMVYFHTDGCIWQVMPDMYEAGADIINPQFRANGIDNLVRVCKGKIPVSLDLDRQLFPFATPEQIKQHILDCAKALYMPEGGLWLGAEVDEGVPLENVRAICEGLTLASELKF